MCECVVVVLSVSLCSSNPWPIPMPYNCALFHGSLLLMPYKLICGYFFFIHPLAMKLSNHYLNINEVILFEKECYTQDPNSCPLESKESLPTPNITMLSHWRFYMMFKFKALVINDVTQIWFKCEPLPILHWKSCSGVFNWGLFLKLSDFFFCNAKNQREMFHRFLKQVVNLSCYTTIYLSCVWYVQGTFLPAVWARKLIDIHQ